MASRTHQPPIRLTRRQLEEELKASNDFLERGEDGSVAIFADQPDEEWVLAGSGDPSVIEESGNGVWIDPNGQEQYGPVGTSPVGGPTRDGKLPPEGEVVEGSTPRRSS